MAVAVTAKDSHLFIIATTPSPSCTSSVQSGPDKATSCLKQPKNAVPMANIRNRLTVLTNSQWESHLP